MSTTEQQVNMSGIALFDEIVTGYPVTIGWTLVSAGTPFSQVSAGSMTQVWGVHPTGWIYQRQDGEWQQVSGSLTCVSVAADGTVWGVNAGGSIFRRENGDWKQIPGSLRQISVGSATQVWGVNAGGSIFQWNGSDFVVVPGTLTWVSAAADGTVWGVNAGGAVFRRESGGWTQMSLGPVSQISVGSATQVVGVNSRGDVFQWVNTSGGWSPLPSKMTNISVASDGTLWGVNAVEQRVYYYVHAAPLILYYPHLCERTLEQGETAAYGFQVTNTVPGTVLKNVKLTLLYDSAAFASAGLTVASDTVAVPDLPYAHAEWVCPVHLTASPTARVGRHAFQGVKAEYQIVPVPSPHAPVFSNAGGAMPFEVIRD